MRGLWMVGGEPAGLMLGGGRAWARWIEGSATLGVRLLYSADLKHALNAKGTHTVESVGR